MIKKTHKLLTLTFLAIFSQAFAEEGTTNIQSSATLNPTCLISASNINFGVISTSPSGEQPATGIISLICNKDQPYRISVGAGKSGVVTARTMVGADINNTDTLKYNLYIDTETTQYLGDAFKGGFSITGQASGSMQAITIYSKLSLNQYLKPDIYSDNLTIKVDY